MIDTEENPREWKKVKEAIPAMEERFKKARNAYFDTVLMNDDGEYPVDGTIRELEDFRSKAHISWRPAPDYTADHLVPFLQKEAKKIPAYRTAMKMMPWLIAAVCVVAYSGLRLYSAVDVSAPIASREIGIAHVRTAVPNAPRVFRRSLEKQIETQLLIHN